MSLNRLFTLTTIVLFALVELMFSRILIGEWHGYQSSTAGLAAMQTAYKALVVAEKASFERGPTNGVLGNAYDPKKLAKLRKARAVTDAALHDFLGAVAGDPGLPHRREALDSMRQAALQLAAARRDVDRVAARPKSRRTHDQVMGAVHEMFDVIPVVMQAATALSRGAEDVYPQFSDALVAARLAADLREYAGRLGSQFTAALTQQKPLADGERLAIAAMRGRLEELRLLIQLRTQTQDTDARVVAAEHAMEDNYFGAGLAFAGSVEAASEQHRPYGLDTAQFAARYQPPMASIVTLRDVLLLTAVEGARASHDEARKNLVLISLMGLATAFVVVMIFLLIRWRVVRPLLQTTRVIVDIAHGELHTEVPPAERRDEIGAMLKAVVTLKANSIEKRRLEHELQHLVGELKSMSGTDYLTGIRNRRAFAEAAELELANARRFACPLALIMFDIDHFKAINDRYGHDAGDAVLVEIAAVAKREVREGDVVARHGGEEFIVLAPHCDADAAAALAERIRAAIERARVPLPDGRTIACTASFGCVAANGAHAESLEPLLHAVDRTLYAAKEAGRNRVISREHGGAVSAP